MTSRGYPPHGVDGIYTFLDDFNNGGPHPPPYAVPRNYYASQVTVGSESSARAAPQSSYSYSEYSEGGTSPTPNPSVFSGNNGGNAYTVSTAPSVDGDERDFHQHPFVPPPPPPPSLPCEFRQYSGCRASFALDDVTHWINHIVTVHLDGRYPRHSSCWFCNRTYEASSDSSKDKKKYFVRRMQHIAGHWQQGEMTWDNMRPDFHFIDHIYRERIIGEAEYHSLRGYSEVPEHGYSTFHAAGFRRPERELADTEIAWSSPRREGGDEPRRHRQRRFHR